MVLADADVMIDVFRQYAPAMKWLASVGQEGVALPGFVAMELIKGCRTSTEQKELEAFLRGHEIVWPIPMTCDKALLLFVRRRLRYGLGIIDALVAQLAIDLGANLVTFNKKHYGGIPGLKIVQPYER